MVKKMKKYNGYFALGNKGNVKPVESNNYRMLVREMKNMVYLAAKDMNDATGEYPLYAGINIWENGVGIKHLKVNVGRLMFLRSIGL